MAAFWHMAQLTIGSDRATLHPVESPMLGRLPHLPLRMIRTHVTFGTDGRITDDSKISQVIAVAAATGVFHHMATIATELAHFTALLEKAGAHDVGKGERTPFFMAETALALIPTRQISCTPPPGVQSRPVLAFTVFGESLLMAAGTNCGDHWGIPLQYFVVIVTVAGTTTDVRCRMSALLPLSHGTGGLLHMAVKTSISEQDGRDQQ
mgnify:CR=1 FL=1